MLFLLSLNPWQNLHAISSSNSVFVGWFQGFNFQNRWRLSITRVTPGPRGNRKPKARRIRRVGEANDSSVEDGGGGFGELPDFSLLVGMGETHLINLLLYFFYIGFI